MIVLAVVLVKLFAYALIALGVSMICFGLWVIRVELLLHRASVAQVAVQRACTPQG